MDNSIGAIFWLKEFSKSWVHIISNKVVYYEQVLEQDSGRFSGVCGIRSYIKDYLSFNLWLEIVFKIRRITEFELYTALIETSKAIHVEPFGTTQPSGDIDFGCPGQNNAMLVNVVNSGEKPERMPSPLPIRSIIRLHRLDIRPDVAAKAFEFINEFRTVLNVDRENSTLITLNSERPSDVIKGRTQSVGNFAYQKSPG